MEPLNQTIKLHLSDGILHITLNRPEALNALNQDLLSALSDCFHKVRHDQKIKVVVLSGQGKAFCAGADIHQLENLDGVNGLKFARIGQNVFSQLENLNKPSIALIHGYAFGGGLELAMAASIRLASVNAQMGQPEIKLGVIPGFGGTKRLSRLAGVGRALYLCLTGQRFNAEDGKQFGLINDVYSEDDLLPKGMALAKKLGHQSPVAMESIMSVINKGYHLPLDEALELEAAHFSICCTTKDKTEGVKAFLEKREPCFQGA